MRAARGVGLHLLVFGLVLAVALPLGIGIGRPSGPPRVTLLPTDDGPTFLIEDGDGRRILIGGGETDAALRALSERTLPWQRRVDLLVLPPPFRQHLPGATALVRRTDIQRIIELGGPGTKPPARYDPWQLATLDRGRIPERLWSHAALALGGGAMLDLIAPDAPDGVPARLPGRPPRASSTTRAKPEPTGADAEAATGAFVRLTNGRTSILLALGAPDGAVPGFARLLGPTMLVASQSPALPTLVGAVRPWSLLALTTGAENGTDGLPTRTLAVPQGSALTLALDGDHVRVHGLPHPPAWG